MSMHLVGPYLTTTRYNGKKKPSAKEQRAKVEHEAWLRKQGLHPDQLATRKASKGSIKTEKNLPSFKVDQSIPLSNNIVDGGRVRGIMANLHKESPEVQKEILYKASRCMPLYNKGGIQFATPSEDLTQVGSKSRRG